ncbi:MAG: hypothetical protein Q9204_003094 [Flavoplaca sp. TL-2023a]
MAHSSVVIKEWETLINYLSGEESIVTLNGNDLGLGALVVVSGQVPQICYPSACLDAVAATSVALQASLEEGQIIYGVNTGFGGSADSRTKQVEELQRTLIRELHYGIGASPHSKEDVLKEADGTRARKVIPGSSSRDQLFPEDWVRASILVRLNSLVSGRSGVRGIIIETLSQLLNRDVVPKIPLRGSISASGDLSPLSYVAGTIQGKSTIGVRYGSESGIYNEMTAEKALAEAKILPVTLTAKEGLAIVNGTAVSAGVAALALWETHNLAIMSQLLTAMAVEALSGTDESFDPGFGRVRPHPGQIDCSNNIYRFLEGSKLVHHNDGDNDALRQDRYSIRTASQWLGPVLEDLLLAHQQMHIEMNSVTDNPIFDADSHRILHGGNFQAKAVTSATEKVRQSIQTIGRMLFVQCTEMINPTTNGGLPPNLTVEDPSTSFVMKAVDIMTAALQSELGFLANPVGSHVQTAEMGNQSLNSLALISARYTHTAVEVLTELTAAHLFTVCQALDLRVMNLLFLQDLEPRLLGTTSKMVDQHLSDASGLVLPMFEELWSAFLKRFDETAALDAECRFIRIMDSLQPVLLRHIVDKQASGSSASIIKSWSEICASLCLQSFAATREDFLQHADASSYLGTASGRIYRFVREILKVPLLQSAHIRTPHSERSVAECNTERPQVCNPESNTVGSYIATIYDALLDGRLYRPALECLQDGQPG